jgi:hypothetical protein
MGRPILETINFAALGIGTTGASLATMPQLDMTGYEGCLFIGYTQATDTSNQLIALVGTATGAMTELTGPTGGEASGIVSNLYLDVFRPPKRYIEGQMRSSGTTGNSFVMAIRYGARTMPTTQDTASWNGRTLSPAVTGTATVSG